METPKASPATCEASSAPGCSTIPDVVIIEMQKRAYQMMDNVKSFEKVVEESRAELDKSESELAGMRYALRQVADFLQQYNSDAQDDCTWHEALGLVLNTAVRLRRHERNPNHGNPATCRR